jgi:predicted DNA-binding protein with PD1-like motif
LLVAPEAAIRAVSFSRDADGPFFQTQFSMKSKRLSHDGGETHALIFATGDEVMAGLKEFVRRENIRAAHFTAIGAFSSAVLAYFDWEKKEYAKIPVNEQVEALVLTGDVAWNGDEPAVHAHAVLGRRDGSTIGGHLISAKVRPTLEVALTSAGALRKRIDPESGLALIAID